MVLTLILLLCVAAPRADEHDLYPSSPLGALLYHARQAEGRGQDELALDYLGALEARLLAGEGMEAPDAVSALALLGSLRLVAGDEVGAEAAFRLMAGRFPGETPCPPCPPRSPPAALYAHSLPPISGWDYVPLGAPQFAQQRPRAGMAWGGAQLVVGLASVALFAHLGGRKAAIEDGVGWSGRAERRDAMDSWERTQLTVQVPVTFAFYGLWAGSVVEARHHETGGFGNTAP